MREDFKIQFFGSFRYPSDLSLNTSLNGSYKNLDDGDSQSNDSVLCDPPKEKHRLWIPRSKTKKSSKNSQSPEAQDSVKDRASTQDYFSKNLETVEKDFEHKQVPKIVVECIKVIESSENIVTAGLYRVSGNKTQIEAFKKKSNDKKLSKKEPRSTLLESQDVHCLTGILKMFFRELSPPLMPSEIFSACTAGKVFLEPL